MATATACDRKLAGCVKWFNMKTGFGFLTVVQSVCGSDLKVGSEIFVHHSNVKVAEEQYRFLVQGEYVEFGLSSVSSGDHECQASDVSGIKGGKLMCETRHELVATRTSYKAQDKSQDKTQTPVEKASDDAPWTPAKKPRQQAAPAPDQTPAKAVKSTSGRGAGRGQTTAGRGSTGGRGGRGRGKTTA
jgi:cold shock CspA family protein